MDLFPIAKRKNAFRNILGANSQTDNGIKLDSIKKLFPSEDLSTVALATKQTLNPDGSEGSTRFAKNKLMDLYNEPSPNTERYNSYLESQPSQTEYAPSKKRRLGAALLGGAIGATQGPIAGISVGSRVNDAPFEDALSDWERKRLPLQNAATAETAGRTQKINALKDYITAEHQSNMDESTLADRKHDNQLGDATLLETVAQHQATSAAEAARLKALEEDRLRQERNRVEDNTRATSAAEETKRHNRETEGIARTNASAATSRASTYASSVIGLNAYRDHLKAQLKAAKGNSPAAQKTAQDLAHTNIVLKPGNSQKYADFYDTDDKGRIKITPPSKGYFANDDEFNAQLASYGQFLKEIDNEKKAILAENHPTETNKQAPNGGKPKAKVLSRETVKSPKD